MSRKYAALKDDGRCILQIRDTQDHPVIFKIKEIQAWMTLKGHHNTTMSDVMRQAIDLMHEVEKSKAEKERK